MSLSLVGSLSSEFLWMLASFHVVNLLTHEAVSVVSSEALPPHGLPHRISFSSFPPSLPPHGPYGV